MLLSFRIRPFRVILILTALSLSAASLIYSHYLTRNLYEEEVAKMQVWAQAMRSLTAADEGTDLSLVLQVINSNHTIPVVVADAHGNILAQRNLWPEPSGVDSLQQLHQTLLDFKRSGHEMQLDLAPTDAHNIAHDYIYVYYDESVLLRQLTIYPYIQLLVVAIFFVVAIVALLASKRAEQNRVWVGLSRETAHQLGTPISSLMAWSEVLRESYPDDVLLPEMDKDIQRLQLIAERFSKIGSAPELSEHNLGNIVQQVADYFSRRTSVRVEINAHVPVQPIMAHVNAPLFEWVLENLCKNAIDAMQGEGRLILQLVPQVYEKRHRVFAQILVTDTGKGIPHNRFQMVFKPGFTTKRRGWGLGLSLAKRIVEEYHHGRIYVQSSQVGVGTTFAIEVEQIVCVGGIS